MQGIWIAEQSLSSNMFHHCALIMLVTTQRRKQMNWEWHFSEIFPALSINVICILLSHKFKQVFWREKHLLFPLTSFRIEAILCVKKPVLGLWWFVTFESLFLWHVIRSLSSSSYEETSFLNWCLTGHLPVEQLAQNTSLLSWEQELLPTCAHGVPDAAHPSFSSSWLMRLNELIQLLSIF